MYQYSIIASKLGFKEAAERATVIAVAKEDQPWNGSALKSLSRSGFCTFIASFLHLRNQHDKMQ